jgi:hypothetical protein
MKQAQTSEQKRRNSICRRRKPIYKWRHGNELVKQGKRDDNNEDDTFKIKLAISRIATENTRPQDYVKFIPIWVQNTDKNNYASEDRIYRQHTKKYYIQGT